jgi:exopolysaccharide biosynthesis predicted pyruvyltransferase EpsI
MGSDHTIICRFHRDDQSNSLYELLPPPTAATSDRRFQELADRITCAQDLADLFSCLEDEEVWYLPNPGNGGDGLIAAATFELAKKHRCDLKYVNVEEQQDFNSTDKIVLYAGGGNLIPEYSECRGAIAKWHEQAALFILLPHTIAGHLDLLSCLRENVFLICRERVSYAYVTWAAPKARALLMHDAAFHLPISKFRKNYWKPENRVLHCFRQDKESCRSEWPSNNLDISNFYVFEGQDSVIESYVARQMLAFIQAFPVIHTDRLHVAIGAALLGKEVVLFPNSYYKNEAIYEFSLRDRFPLVRWATEEDLRGGG